MSIEWHPIGTVGLSCGNEILVWSKTFGPMVMSFTEIEAFELEDMTHWGEINAPSDSVTVTREPT